MRGTSLAGFPHPEKARKAEWDCRKRCEIWKEGLVLGEVMMGWEHNEGRLVRGNQRGQLKLRGGGSLLPIPSSQGSGKALGGGLRGYLPPGVQREWLEPLTMGLWWGTSSVT